MSKKTVSIFIDSDLLEQIDRGAEALGISRSLFINNLLFVAMDDYKLFEKTGLIAFLRKFREIKDSLLISRLEDNV